MTATLRLVVDQLVAPVDPDLAEATTELGSALVVTAPRGCVVAGIAPAPGLDPAPEGFTEVQRMPLARRELAASWQLGIAPGVGKGLIHSPTLLAPLVRHDRVNDTHQIVVTVWDLGAWDGAGDLPRGEAMAQRALLKRAEKHADAVVVPTHAMAERIAELAAVGGRVRVIPGAPPAGFRLPTDTAGRLRALGLPPRVLTTAGGPSAADGLDAAFRAAAGVDLDVVVLDAPAGTEAAILDIAASAGIDAERVHVRGALDPHDRAAVLGSSAAFLAPAERFAWPWRLVEALGLGIPVVAVDGAVHREVLADAGILAAPDDLGDALARALGPDAARQAVLSGDRAKGFSWREAAERIWQLHADL